MSAPIKWLLFGTILIVAVITVVLWMRARTRPGTAGTLTGTVPADQSFPYSADEFLPSRIHRVRIRGEQRRQSAGGPDIVHAHVCRGAERPGGRLHPSENRSGLHDAHLHEHVAVRHDRLHETPRGQADSEKGQSGDLRCLGPSPRIQRAFCHLHGNSHRDENIETELQRRRTARVQGAY